MKWQSDEKAEKGRKGNLESVSQQMVDKDWEVVPIALLILCAVSFSSSSLPLLSNPTRCRHSLKPGRRQEGRRHRVQSVRTWQRRTTERQSRLLKAAAVSFSSLLCLIAVIPSSPANLPLPHGNVAEMHHQHATPIQLERRAGWGWVEELNDSPMWTREWLPVSAAD